MELSDIPDLSPEVKPNYPTKSMQDLINEDFEPLDYEERGREQAIKEHFNLTR